MDTSVRSAEGLHLKGAGISYEHHRKSPLENLSDEFIKYRNNHDNYLRYNTYAAVAVMQSAGRCTRSVDDFSETWILNRYFVGQVLQSLQIAFSALV